MDLGYCGLTPPRRCPAAPGSNTVKIIQRVMASVTVTHVFVTDYVAVLIAPSSRFRRSFHRTDNSCYNTMPRPYFGAPPAVDVQRLVKVIRQNYTARHGFRQVSVTLPVTFRYAFSIRLPSPFRYGPRRRFRRASATVSAALTVRSRFRAAASFSRRSPAAAESARNSSARSNAGRNAAAGRHARAAI